MRSLSLAVVVGVVVGAAAGCYRPAPADCAITCAAGFCPDGLTCSNQFCVADPGTVCTPVPDADPDRPDADPNRPDAVPDAVAVDVMANMCTNGFLETGEECDDGNMVDGDGCTNSCQTARCGDDIVRIGVEECDDGNGTDNDGCSSSCLFCANGAAQFTWTNGNCYWRSNGPDFYTIARGDCYSNNAHLVTYGSASEEVDVHGALVLPFAPGSVWIGMTDEILSGTLRWETEEVITHTNWAPGQPAPENYAIQQDGTMWVMLAGAMPFPYLCEQEPWFVRAGDNHAYRLFYDAKTWAAAADKCTTIGGHLAVITDDSERTFLDANISLARSSTGMIDRGAFWIGGNDLTVEGAFQWEDGTPVATAFWEVGAPNDGGGGEDCLSVWGDAHNWNDRSCAVPLPYLCEIDF